MVAQQQSDDKPTLWSVSLRTSQFVMCKFLKSVIETNDLVSIPYFERTYPLIIRCSGCPVRELTSWSAFFHRHASMESGTNDCWWARETSVHCCGESSAGLYMCFRLLPCCSWF